MTDISFLLPTARAIDHPNVLRECIEGINREHASLNYEILAYSRYFVEGENVKWIKEEGECGPIRGFNLLASEFAKGDYLVCITDDHLIIDSAKLCIDNIENTFNDRKYKIGGLMPQGLCYMPQRGDELGTHIIEENLPRVPLLRFPVVRKDTVKLLGGCIFHPDLFYHAGDIWLGYFLHEKGETAIEGPTRVREIQRLKNPTYEVADCDVVYALIKRYLAGHTDYIS